MNKPRKKIETASLLLAVILIGVYLIAQCKNNTIWCDEAFSIMLAKSNLRELLQLTAEDVHPPLYYLGLKIMGTLFGYNAFVFHLTSALPIIVLLVWAATICRKKFGFETAFIFILLLSFMPCSDFCLVLIRMYSLAIMFVTLCFYAGYELICGGERKYWWLFTVCGLGAAYTHYFAFVTVAVIYLCIFSVLIYRNRKTFRNCLIVSIVSVVGYLPWLYCFIKSVESVNEDYWISGFPTFHECITFLLGEGISGYILLTVFIGSFLLFRARTKRNINNESIMVIIALIVTMTVIVFGDAYSYFIKPIFITRYLYPLAGIVWVALGIVFSQANKRIWVFVVLIFYIGVNIIPGSIANYKLERDMNSENSQTIKYIEENYEEGDVLTSDRDQLPWRIYDYYLPGMLTSNFDEIDWNATGETATVYMFNTQEIEKDMSQMLNEQGMQIRLVRKDSYIGKYPGYLYEIVRK